MALSFAACGGGNSTLTRQSQVQHVVVIILAAQDQQVMATSMPYWNELARRYGVMRLEPTSSTEIGNYFLTPAGVDPTARLIDPNDWTGTYSCRDITKKLTTAGKNWKVYAQSIPSSGYTGGDSYSYLQLHNPFASCDFLQSDPSQMGNIVPIDQLGLDLKNITLPAFSVVAPDSEHSGLDCPDGSATCPFNVRAAGADEFLKYNTIALLNDARLMKNTVLIITFDPNSNNLETSSLESQLIIVRNTSGNPEILNDTYTFNSLVDMSLETLQARSCSDCQSSALSAVPAVLTKVSSGSGIANLNDTSQSKPNSFDSNLSSDDVPEIPSSAESLTPIKVLHFADQYQGRDIGAQINAAIADLPPYPIGGEVFIASSVKGCRSFSTQIVIDRPVILRGEGFGFFGQGTCLQWVGGAIPAISINGAAGNSSHTKLEQFTLMSGGTGTVGVDIYNNQYNVTLRDFVIDKGPTAFSVAGVRIGNNSFGAATIDTLLENIRIANQTVGLQLLLSNTSQCVACHIYNNSIANVQVGDSTHQVNVATFTGGNVEQDIPAAPSFIVNNVQSLLLTDIYVEINGANQTFITIPKTAMLAQNIKWDGGYAAYNSTGQTLLDSAFSGTTASLARIYYHGAGMGSALVTNTASDAISIRDIYGDGSIQRISTGSVEGIKFENARLTSIDGHYSSDALSNIRTIAGSQVSPTCDAGHGGIVWYESKGVGEADQVQVCAKNAAGVYGWRIVF
jgi:hypothetical protein